MKNNIECPRCHHVFDVEDALSSKLEEQYKIKYDQKLEEQFNEFNRQREELTLEKENFKLEREKEQEFFNKKLAESLSSEKLKIQKEVGENFEAQLKQLKEDNAKKKEENRQLKSKELELLKKENELKEKTEELEFNLQKQLLEKQTEIEEKAKAKERETFELEKKQLLKQIEDNKKLAEEMKRKAEQGSMQMQGEVQELALEELLRSTYPFDNIDEIAKGVRGADCIQTVINSEQKVCGTIVYESKRTKNFANEWIGKLKQDQIQSKADIAVIVTETYPKEMDRFGERNGVWICGFHEVKSLSFVLREMLIKTHSVKSSEQNRGDKMVLLYTYLTSNEFIQNVKRIVENYDEMIQQLNSEKTAMLKIWAKREKQIWVVQENLSAMFGSIKGIAGSAIETGSLLELPDRE